MVESKALLADLERLHPRKIDLSLGRIFRLVEKLGNPHKQLPSVVHVAGTNGKGSVIAFLDAMLSAAGKNVHTFTSPHLTHFHERIRLASGPGVSAPISEKALIDILTRAEYANGDDPITFFEITTAAAFLAFSEHPADYLLLETGLGGRLDATNVVDKPALTVITPVSIDHTGFLGTKINEIASEKAGILKPGVTCILSRQTAEAFEAIESRALSAGAPLAAAGREWDVFEQQGRLVYQQSGALLDLPLPRLVGRHQIENAGTAIAAVRTLLGSSIHEKHIEKGLRDAVWPARLERLGHGWLHRLCGEGTEIWLDGGHNPAAARSLAQTVAEIEERVSRPLHLVCGMLRVKDAYNFLSAFKGLVEFVTTISIPGHDQSYDAEELAEIARAIGLHAGPAIDLENALEQSRNLSPGPTRVLICGSLYLASHVYAAHYKSDVSSQSRNTDINRGPRPLNI